MLTNEQAKQEAIKKAYGDKWKLVKSLTPNRKDSNDAFDLYNNGFFNTKRLKLNMVSISDIFNNDLFDFDGKFTIPKSLKSVSTNNGWIRIEPDGSNLLNVPLDFYRVLIADGSIEKIKPDTSLVEALIYWKITHYKRIEKELLPIY